MPGTIRCAVLSDLHCGHELGLSTPDWWPGEKRRKKAQKKLWEFFTTALDDLVKPPVDVALILGDTVEGPQEKYRGIELLVPSVHDQCLIAAEVIKMLEAKMVYMVRGSPYHSGMAEEYEDLVAKEVGAKIADEMLVKVGDVWFHLKHFTGRSSIPHGKATPLARDWLIQVLVAARSQNPSANVLLRGHVHYYAFTGGVDWLAMSVPALCLSSSKTSRRTRGGTEVGLVVFEVEGGDWRWEARVAPVTEQCEMYRVVVEEREEGTRKTR